MSTHRNNRSTNDVLIAIPVHNESRYVEDILTAVSRYGSNILVVNDGSDDGTDELLEKHKYIEIVTHKTNEGYGRSLIDAFEFAKTESYDWIITMDCDHQHQPSWIPRRAVLGTAYRLVKPGMAADFGAVIPSLCLPGCWVLLPAGRVDNRRLGRN